LRRLEADRSFPTQLLRKGTDLAILRDLLAHSDISVTSRYLGASPERAEALGVARVVARDALTPETLAAAIREVLESPDFAKRARYHRDRLHAESSPSARVCELVTAFMSKLGAIEPG